MASYGTSNQNDSNETSTESRHRLNGEDQPLLPGNHHHQAHKSSLARFKAHLTSEVDKEHGDLVLLLCYVITGLLDSSATAIWGAFVSMQTGNTIYLGLGLADPTGSTRWLKSLTSISFFCVGSFCFAWLHRQFSPKRRWVLMLSFTIQFAMVIASAAIVTFTPQERKSDKQALHWQVLVPLALVGFQSSGQAVTSRVLGFGPLTSVVLTSIYCDLFSDVNIFAGLTQNIERNRRVAAPVLVLAGAISGGLWSKSEIGLAGALWTAAGMKLLIVVAWLFWRTDKKS